MAIILFLCFYLATSHCTVDGSMSNIPKDENLELERQLKLMNKYPVKSIQTEFGHIVDCIDIHKQLAFDHPLLKNHKLQLKPSFKDTTTETNMHKRSASPSNIGLQNDSCPTGTVPIQRTTKEDLIRAKSLPNITSTLTLDLPGWHFAELRLNLGRAYYGVNGTVSVYNPKVDNDQMSEGRIWLKRGRHDTVNLIFAGWQVYPRIYGDKRTHFYISWRDNSKHRGCYNLRCPGFVQIDKKFYAGMPLAKTSSYGGLQYDMKLSLTQDPNTENWWVRFEDTYVGYFPHALFSNFASAEEGGWGGATLAPIGRPSPPMGSGYFPDGFPSHAMYFREISFRNENRQDNGPSFDEASIYSDNRGCYDVIYYERQKQAEVGYALLVGGPGGGCGN